MTGMVAFRTGLAILALGVVAAVFLTVDPVAAVYPDRPLVWALWAFVIPVVLTVFGLLRRSYQARWAGIAIGLAVLPMATAFTLDMTAPRGDVRAPVTLVASAVLIAALMGRSMFQAFEGRATTLAWSGPRMGLVRWAVIANIASAFGLFFISVGSQMISLPATLLASVFLAVVVAGVSLLARQKTAGLLLLAGGCMGLVPVGGYLLVREPSPLGAFLVLGGVFGPGILLALAVLLVYAKPLVRHLLSG
jgi:hypothetical protein